MMNRKPSSDWPIALLFFGGIIWCIGYAIFWLWTYMGAALLIWKHL